MDFFNLLVFGAAVMLIGMGAVAAIGTLLGEISREPLRARVPVENRRR